MKDTNFYNKESAIYSAKRYPKQAVTFTQFFFKERLRLTLALLAKYMPEGKISMLEIGCADGVVARAIWREFGRTILNFEAVDISPRMIDAAKQQNTDTSIRFSVREGSALPGIYGCIIEVGVLNYLEFKQELTAVHAALQSGGIYICSISGKSSLQTLLKGDGGFMHLEAYAAYEKEFSKYFTITKTVPVGLFIPLLWKVPSVASLLQPALERITLLLVPNLAHEKVYVLTK